MGLLNNSREKAGASLYERKAKKYLRPKNGNVHILMINVFSDSGDQNFKIDEKPTAELNPVIEGMQNDGYEIITIKFNSVGKQGLSGSSTKMNVMILYK